MTTSSFPPAGSLTACAPSSTATSGARAGSRSACSSSPSSDKDNKGSRRVWTAAAPPARPSLVAGSARDDGQPPAQVVVEAPRLLQLLHALDAYEARACERLRAHAVPA